MQRNKKKLESDFLSRTLQIIFILIQMPVSKVFTFQEFLSQEEFFIEEAKKGKIFIYPTDTIYGLGCISTDANKTKINTIKQRPEDKLLSVIAPNKKRIQESYEETDDLIDNLDEYVQSHHGVTFIFSDKKSGVRLIKHPFQNFVARLWAPFITTSVNLSGETNCNSIDDISEDILPFIDYIIDDGPIYGKSSVLIDMRKGEIIER